jgi:hypothetical protein
MSFTWAYNTWNYCHTICGLSRVKGDDLDVGLWTDKSYRGDHLSYVMADGFPIPGTLMSSDGLYLIKSPNGQIGWIRSLMDIGLSGLPVGSSIVSATLSLTVYKARLVNPVNVDVYKINRAFDNNATAINYKTSNTWYTSCLAPGMDYDATKVTSFSVGISAVTGTKVTIDLTNAVVDAYDTPDQKLRVLLMVPDNEAPQHIVDNAYLGFYTGYTGSYYWSAGSWDAPHLASPNIGSAAEDKPILEVQYNTPMAFVTSDGGNLTINSAVISIDSGYHLIGWYIAGAAGEAQKYFIKNNSEGTIQDVCIWSDFSYASPPVFSGSGTVSMSYITVGNDETPGNQRWRTKCSVGGSNSVWSVEHDNGTFVSTGTSTWSAASPSGFVCSGLIGSYTSTVGTYGLSFGITGSSVQLNDTFSWETHQDIKIPDVPLDSDSMVRVAVDISGSPGTWKMLQPDRTQTISSVSAGATGVTVLDNTIFSVNDNVVVFNTLTSNKVYNTISGVTTGGYITLTGGVPWNVVPGFLVYQAPVSVGDLDQVSYWITNNKPFWLRVDPPGGIDVGLRMCRFQATEGP